MIFVFIITPLYPSLTLLSLSLSNLASHHSIIPSTCQQVFLANIYYLFYRFTGQANVHSVLIYTAPTPSAPKTLKLFKNRDDLDFSTASELKPTQTIEVPQPIPGTDVFELPLNRAHWNATTSVTLFFEDNWSDGEEDVTKVGYIGLKGQFMALNREPVSFLYEAAANPNDHVAIPGVSGVGSRIMPGQ
jgi:hypothetical protein